MKNSISSVENTKNRDRKIARAAAEYAYSGKSWKACRDLYDAYKNPSIYKRRAFQRCVDLCNSMNGFNLLIASYGVQTFSVVFEYPDEETGELCYAYITRDYDRFCYQS